MSAPLVFPLRRGRLALLTLGALAFVVGGVWFAWRLGPPSLDFARNRLEDEALRAIGVLSAAFFGACGLALAGLVLRRGPGLVIDDVGIVEHTSGRAAGRLAWAEITAIRLVPGEEGFVGLELADVEAHLDRLPPWRRWLLRSNMAAGSPPAAIHAAAIGQDAAALAALLVAERARRAPGAGALEPG